MRSATELAPVRITRKAPRNTRSGLTRPEVWGAVTIDGVWGIERQDDTSTVWFVHHLPSLADASCPWPVLVETTLKACRAGIADGTAAATLAMLRCAHDRDDTRFRVDDRGVFWQDCARCGASRVWHIECRACEDLAGHDWAPGLAVAA